MIKRNNFPILFLNSTNVQLLLTFECNKSLFLSLFKYQQILNFSTQNPDQLTLSNTQKAVSQISHLN